LPKIKIFKIILKDNVKKVQRPIVQVVIFRLTWKLILANALVPVKMVILAIRIACAKLAAKNVKNVLKTRITALPALA
jgi:hypothetical protein